MSVYSEQKRRYLTHGRLVQLFSYDAQAGRLVWKIRHQKARPGDFAGGHAKAFTRIAVDGVVYSGAQLVWFYHHKAWPPSVVGHRNGDPTDDRIENLYDPTSDWPDGSPRMPGVYFVRGAKPFRAALWCPCKRALVHLGQFPTVEEAKAVLDAAVARRDAGLPVKEIA